MEGLGVAAIVSIATLLLAGLKLWRQSETDYTTSLERRIELLQKDKDELATNVDECDEEKELMRKANANQQKQIFDLMQENRVQAQEIRDLQRRLREAGREL